MAFTCITYGYSKETSVNVVRSKIVKMVGEGNDLTKKSKVDILHLLGSLGLTSSTYIQS